MSTGESGRRGNDDQDLEGGLNTRDILELLSRKRRLLIAAVVLAVAASTVYHFVYPSYSVKSRLLIESQSENSGLQALLTSLGSNQENGSFNETQDDKLLLALTSASFFRRFADNISKDPAFPQMEALLKKAKTPLRQLREAASAMAVRFGKRHEENYRKWLEASIRPEKLFFRSKGIIEVTFSSVSPELAVFLANHYLDSAVKMFTEREEKKITEARAYIQNKIKETLAKLETTDQKIVGANTKNANLSLLAPQSAIAEQLLSVKDEIQAAKIKHEQNEQFIQSLRAKLTTADANSAVDSMFGVKRTIANLEVQNQILSIRISALQKQLDERVKSNLSLPKEEQQLADLKRQKGLDFYVFDNLFKTLLQIEVRGLSLLNRVYPLERATLSEVTVSLDLLSKLIIALITSLVASIFALYGKNLINPVIRTKKDLSALNLSYLGSISNIESSYFKGAQSQSQLRFQLESKETVLFRQIRSRLLYLSSHSGDKPRKVVSLFSYGNSEGKSFISSNLALCFSHMGKRVLLVDFDLRRASLSKQFGASAKPGLCAHLDEQKPLKDLIVPEVMPLLDLLPAGTLTMATTEHFSNQKFRDLMEQLKPMYDFIVIDTAPIAVAHESLALVQDSDFAVLVASCWKTRRDDVAEAVDEIRNVRNACTHFILNRAKGDQGRVGNNYYYVGMHKRRPHHPIAPAVVAPRKTAELDARFDN